LAPRNIRLNRVQERGRADDSVDRFNDRDWREINYGVAACIAMADEYVLNTGTIENAFIQLDKIVKKNLI
jgi:dephospho-CoA kinase